MLENDNNELSDPQKVEEDMQPEKVIKKPRRKQRRRPAKKRAMAGPWPKIAIAAIILCLVFAGISISMLSRGTTDITVPIIENITISDVIDSSTVISWKTSEPATSQVTICSTDNCTSTKTDESLFLNHTVAVSDIKPNTRYQLTVLSRNAQGKEAKITLELNLNAKTTIVIGPEIGALAPDFTLPTVDGKQTTLSQFRGKAVILNFWDTTCPACAEEMPFIQAIFDQWPRDKLVIFGINEERIQFVQSYLDTRGLTFPVLLDTNEAIKNTYRVSAYPTTFFIDSDGIIKVIKSGRFSSKSEIETILKSL
jgi:peroxiredoxin